MSRATDLEMLGLAEPATPLEIHTAWRKLSVDLHPDHGGELTEEQRQKLARVWQAHRAAFQRLLASDPAPDEPPQAEADPVDAVLGFVKKAVSEETPEGRLIHGFMKFFRG